MNGDLFKPCGYFGFDHFSSVFASWSRLFVDALNTYAHAQFLFIVIRHRLVADFKLKFYVTILSIKSKRTKSFLVSYITSLSILSGPSSRIN